jgi:hypothetical protein
MGLVWIAPGILRYLKTCRLKYNDSLQIQGNANAKFFLRIHRDGRLGIVSTATTWLETVASVAGKSELWPTVWKRPFSLIMGLLEKPLVIVQVNQHGNLPSRTY